jgi:branched-chain amino acid transport system permease protein
MLFMVLVGGIGTIEGPVIGALILFALQQWLSQEGAWYLVLVGGIAVVATLAVPRGLWGFASSRWGWSLFPIGYRLPGRDHHREPG